MNDLTLLYYTANTIEDACAQRVRDHLTTINNDNSPIISVSQKPLDFGENICVGEVGQSYYNCYKQILIGAQAARTKYVACCEDDTLYTQEHFTHRPSADDVFAYNANLWLAENRLFWKHGDSGMCACIAVTENMVRVLSARYEMYPTEIPTGKRGNKNFQEPGRFDRKFGIPNAKTEHFVTQIPVIVFNRRHSLGGKRGLRRNEHEYAHSLNGWGRAYDVWARFWNYENT